MNFILVIDRIVTGGAERILIDYYHYLEKKGHKPYIFALTGNRTQSKWTDGLRVIFGSPNDENNLLKKSLQQISLLFKLKKLVKDFKPIGIFSFLEKSNLITIFTPARNVQKVVSVHNLLSIQYKKIQNNFVRKLVYKMIQVAYNHCSHVVAVSNQVRNDLITSLGVFPKNIFVINNYVEKDELEKKSIEPINNFYFDDNVKYIINVGRFSDQKAQWKLIKAFFLYSKKSESNVELVLIGAGDYARNLQKLSKDLNISQKVHVLPFNINPYKYMVKAHLFVLSSSFEGFPIVLAEMSSLRIPFVGSRKSIPEEMFDDKSVWESCIFECQNIEADFSTTIHDDEKKLALIIQKGIEDCSFREKILEHTQLWESGNQKINQFKMYDKLLIRK